MTRYYRLKAKAQMDFNYYTRDVKRVMAILRSLIMHNERLVFVSVVTEERK